MRTTGVVLAGEGLGRRVFMLAGELPPRPRLGVVGSRAAVRSFRECVPWIADVAGDCGFALVSGGAIGIDGAVHEAALAGVVPQLVVLPCGDDRPYPPVHAPLFERIAGTRGSGVLFAQPRGTDPCRSMFASRNALVVALSDAIVIVQAGTRSGTLLTGKLALRRGLPLAAVVGSAGVGELIAEGAHALPGPEAGEAALRAAVEGFLRGRRSATPTWPEHLRWLRAALARAGRSGLGADDLPELFPGLRALAEAEALGLVLECRPGRFTALG